jgi:hypothetical protein
MEIEKRRKTVKKNLMFMSLFLVVAVMLQAAPIQCPSTATIQLLIALGPYDPATNTGGCAVQDKIFDNFAYTGSDPTTQVQAQVVFQPGGGGQDIHGWLWTNINPVTLSWITPFTLSYTIRVQPGNPQNIAMTMSKDQINGGATGPTNLSALQDMQTGATLNVNSLATGNETQQVSYPGLQLINTKSSAVIVAGGQMLSYEQDFFETPVPTVPEPTTFVMFGAGLILTGALRRRIKRRESHRQF